MKHLSTLLLAICLQNVSVSLSAQTVLSLSDALRLARENNTTLRSEKFNIDISQSDLITAKLRPNPVLNNQSLQLVNSNYYPANTEWYSPLNRQVWWQVTKQFQWPALRRNKIDFATQEIKMTENAYAELEQKIIFDVATQWVDAWRMKQLLTTLQLAQLNLDSLVAIQKARLRNQVITTTELIRTQIPLEQYSLQLKTTRQEYKNALQELKFMVGTSDSIEVSVNTAIESLLVINQTDSLLSKAMQSRPDVKKIQSVIAVSESNIKLQNSQKWPVPELGAIWNPQNTIPYLGFFGTIQIPLFSRNQGGIQKSYLLKQQAQRNFQSIQLKVSTELTAAYQTYQLQKETTTRYAAILQQSNEVLRSVRYAYLKGGTTLIDLLEAQRSWYDTQQLYFNAQATYYQSYVRLLYVAGMIIQL